MTAAISTQAQLPGDNALIVFPETYWVTETPTGLAFEPDTPIEVWGPLTERLVRQSKRIEWFIGDAIRFGEAAYGEDRYTQWVEQTGLSENTLTTYRWVAERIEPLRRRKDVGWSHHREVASLPVPAQESLLDRAEGAGWTRWQVRQAAKAEREKSEGRSATPDGTPIPDGPELWHPGIEHLTDEARAALEAHAPGGRHRQGYVAGFIAALLYADQQDCFVAWGGPA